MLQRSSLLRDVPWTNYRVKDGEKGPMGWEAKRIRGWLDEVGTTPGIDLDLHAGQGGGE